MIAAFLSKYFIAVFTASRVGFCERVSSGRKSLPFFVTDKMPFVIFSDKPDSKTLIFLSANIYTSFSVGV